MRTLASTIALALLLPCTSAQATGKALFPKVTRLHAKPTASARPHDAAWNAYQLSRGEDVGYRRLFATKTVFSPLVMPARGEAKGVEIRDGSYAVHVEPDKTIVVSERPRGYWPGQTFYISRGGVQTNDLRHVESMPTAGSDGGLAWTGGRTHQGPGRVPASDKDRAALEALLAKIEQAGQAHLSAQKQAASASSVADSK